MPSEKYDRYGNREIVYSPEEQEGYWRKYQEDHGRIIEQTDLGQPFNKKSERMPPGMPVIDRAPPRPSIGHKPLLN
jgi:hypothetical protein